MKYRRWKENLDQDISMDMSMNISMDTFMDISMVYPWDISMDISMDTFMVYPWDITMDIFMVYPWDISMDISMFSKFHLLIGDASYQSWALVRDCTDGLHQFETSPKVFARVVNQLEKKEAGANYVH